jgi:hybrid cluster-associated redox disulfide protein
MTEINKDMTIAELMEVAPDKVNVLLMAGMHCVGCPASLGETIEEACMVHGIDVEDLIKELNREGNRFEEENASEEN